MADYDPIAENQTNKVITELEARDDGDPLVNKALAAALRFMQKQGARMDEMDRKLWTAGELERMIDQRHNSACATCPAKKMADESARPKQQMTLPQLILNPAFVVSVIALVAVFMMLRMLGGQVAYKDVTGTAGQIMTGGMVK